MSWQSLGGLLAEYFAMHVIFIWDFSQVQVRCGGVESDSSNIVLVVMNGTWYVPCPWDKLGFDGIEGPNYNG